MHDWIDSALGLVVLALCGLTRRFFNHLDKLEADQDDLKDIQHKYGREIRDTRQAISRLEGKLDIDPFPYTSE